MDVARGGGRPDRQGVAVIEVGLDVAGGMTHQPDEALELAGEGIGTGTDRQPVADFHAMIRTKRDEMLAPWIETASNSLIASLGRAEKGRHSVGRQPGRRDGFLPSSSELPPALPDLIVQVRPRDSLNGGVNAALAREGEHARIHGIWFGALIHQQSERNSAPVITA